MFQAGADPPLPNNFKFFLMPEKSKVLIQTLQKSQDRHKISFSFEFNNKNTQKVFFIALRTRGKDNKSKNRSLERC